VPDEASNALILMDTVKKNEEMIAMLEKMDRPITTEVIELNYAKAEKCLSL